MKRVNLPLLIGSLLVLVLLVVALVPGLFTDRNPYAMSLLQSWVDGEGELHLSAPPFEPDERYVLGSDRVGRDIWSLVVNGTRLTLGLALAVTLLRFLIAVPMGIAGAMGSTGSKNIIDQFNIVLTTIPPLLIGILILQMAFFTSLYKLQSAVVFVLTLALIGWSRMGNLMYESASKIMGETFILSEKAIGKTKRSIACQSVFPHLLPEIVVMFFMEIARVLTLMMQLGIFGVFVGNVRLINDSGWFGYSYINLPYEPEWSGLMGAAKEYVRSAPWIVFTAAAFFVISVLAFNLLGEGLRIELQKKHSRVLSGLRTLFRRSPDTTRDQRLSYMAAVAVLVVVFGTAAYARIDREVEFQDYKRIGYNYEHVIIGSQESAAVSQMIAQGFEDIGVTPLTDGYCQVFDEIDNLYLQESDMMITDGRSSQVLRFGQDIEVIAGHTGNGVYPVIDLTECFYDFGQVDLDGKIVYVDSRIISDEAIEKTVGYLVQSGAEGIVTTHEDVGSGVSQNAPYFQLVLSHSFRDFFEDDQAVLTLDMQSERYNQEAANVIGIIEGQDEVSREKAVFVALDYSFIDQPDSYEILNAYMSLVQTVKAYQEELNNSVIFAFFSDRERGVEHYATRQLFMPKNLLVYHDLMGVDQMTFSKIRFSDELSPVSRYYGFTLSHQLRQDWSAFLSQQPVELNDVNRYLFDDKGYTTLIYEAEGSQGMELESFLASFAELIIDNAR